MGFYHRNRSYKKKTNNYVQPSRKLQMYCPEHGELVGYSNSYDSAVYESFNMEKNRVELNCNKCLEEKIKPAQEIYYSKYNEANNQAYNKYGKTGKFCEKINLICYNLGIWGYIFFLFLWGWLEALVPSGIIIVVGYLVGNKGDSLKKQYIDHRTELTKDLNYVQSAEEIVNNESSIVSSWRMEQARIKKKN